MATEQEMNILKKKETQVVSDYNKEMEEEFDNFMINTSKTI